MPVIFANKLKIIFFLCLVLLASCQNPAEKEIESLKKDAATTTELNRVNQLLTRGSYLSQNDIDSLNKIYEKYPNVPAVRNILQLALIKREDWQTAADFIETIPESERTLQDKINLARILVKQGRYEESLKTTAPLIEEYPTKLELAGIEAYALYDLGRFDEAAQRLDRAWNELINAKSSDDVLLRGMIYFQKKDYPKAIEVLNKSLEFNPENIASFNALTRVYGALGDVAKAEEYAKKAEIGQRKKDEENQKKTKFVESAKLLEAAFKDKRYDEVITRANAMIPAAETANKFALYQYLASAYQALGKPTEAQNALAEAEKLKDQK